MADDLWPCQACTFLNHTLMKSCEICETPRGKDSSASPFAPAARPWGSSSPSFSSPSSSSSSFSSSSACPPFSPSFGYGDEHNKESTEWDEVGQRLDICRKRDYRFLSLEALSLIALPYGVAESLSSPGSASSPPTAAPDAPPESQRPDCGDDGQRTDDEVKEGIIVDKDVAGGEASTDIVDNKRGTVMEAKLPPSPALQPSLDGVRLASQLTTLFLNDNNLAVFPRELARLGQLRELHMHYNKLITLPPCIGDFPHLEKLFLSHNTLISLPPEIGRLTSLQTLSLFNNHLGSVPPQLGQLRSLQSLFLNDNALTSLPPQLFDALSGSLVVLQLNANKLSSLPVQIGRLSRLKKLNVESNALVTVPVSVALLGDLSVLAFRRNLFHYAVSGTWSIGPPTLLHLSCAAVRRHIRVLSPTSSSSSSSSSSLSDAGADVSTLPSPYTAAPMANGHRSEEDEQLDAVERLLNDDVSNNARPPQPDDTTTAAVNRPSHRVNDLDLVQGLNITEELKKLLLEGESACSVCGKLMYGDGHVVRVFPMELVPSLGGGVCLSLVNPALAQHVGTAAAAPATTTTGGGGGLLAATGLHLAAGGNLMTAMPAPTTFPPTGPTNRPKIAVRGTYCSWLCAKRQVPMIGRPDRACVAPPSTTPGAAAAHLAGVGEAPTPSAVVVPLPLTHHRAPSLASSPLESSPTTQPN